MAIPTKLPIKFSDVCLEIYGSSSTSGKTLTQAFTDATGTFNATYEGSKDRLTNFRGYEHIVAPTYTLFQRSISQGDLTSACLDTPTIDCWHDGAGATPVFGDRVYSNSSGTIKLPQGFYKMNSIPLQSFWCIPAGQVDMMQIC